MKLFVQFEVFETVTAPADIARVRAGVGRAIGRLMSSGKVESMGALMSKSLR